MVLVVAGTAHVRVQIRTRVGGHRPSSGSRKGHASVNRFTRLTSCFIILPYYKRSMKPLFPLGWLPVPAEGTAVLPWEDARRGGGLCGSRRRRLLGGAGLFISSYWIAGRGWAGILVCDNMCWLYQMENRQPQFISFPRMLKYLWKRRSFPG